MKTFLIRYRPRALFPRNTAAADALLARVQPYIPEVTYSPSADPESSWEELFRLDAALQAFDHTATWIAPVTPAGLSTPEPLPGNTAPLPDAFDVEWGPEPGSVHVKATHSAPSEHFHYWEFATFLKHARREHIPCTFSPRNPDDRDLLAVARNLSTQHPSGRVFLKGAGTKSFQGVGRVTGNYFLMDSGDELADEINSYALLHLEERSNALIAQPFVDMSHEYRFFIANGAPVAGAGKVHVHTPFDATTHQFDPRISAVPSDVAKPNPELLAKYMTLAQAAAAELFTEQPHLTEYVMDIALAADGEPLIVELNTLGASGLFAVNPVLVAEAVRTGAQVVA